MKTQIKKSISLFLAVLMVLSCWVWVAPEKAEAAQITPTSGQTKYTVEINWTISQRNCDGGDIQYKTLGNGWGTESGWKTALSSMGNNGMTAQGTYTYSWTTEDFPTVVKITTKGGFVTAFESHSRCVVNYIKINGKTVYDGSGGVAFTLPTSKFNATGSAEAYPNYTDADPWGTSGNLGSGYSWPRPHIAGFVDSSATANDINVTLNKVGGANIEKSTSFNINDYTLYDQYGAVASDYIKNNGKYCTVKSQTTYVSGTKNSDDATENTDIWSKGDNDQTVVVSPNLQVSDPKGSTGKAEYYLVRKYVLDDGFGGEQTSKVSAKINVTYPTYDVKFDAKLSQAVLKPLSEEYKGSFIGTNYHGGTIEVPTTAEADGYTFKGFWSKPQPTSGDASYNALEAQFANPCSTVDYESYKATGTVNGDIVTDSDGNKWYDAGVALDASTVRTIDCDGDEEGNPFVETWHGWWISDDISVKFYDVDGAYLGEKAVKYGQTQNDITWPKSKYLDKDFVSGSFTYRAVSGQWVNIDGEVIATNSYTFTKDLILTPDLELKKFEKEYNITFIDQNPDNQGNTTSISQIGDTVYTKSYDYRDSAAVPPAREVPTDIETDLQYSYEFLGWSTVAPINGRYHVLLEDGDFDKNGTAVGLNKDWIVRNEATYYAVYRRHTRSYVVEFSYRDATANLATRRVTVKYGDKFAAPTAYIPYTYATGGFGYEFANWKYTDGNKAAATLGYNTAIVLNKENINLSLAYVEGSTGAISFSAAYGAGVPTPYTVTFLYKNDEGEDEKTEVEVKNESYITSDTLNSLAPATEYDNGEALVTYLGKWAVVEGAADQTEYETNALLSFSPTSHITFEAVYGNPKPFYTVTYIDGAKTYSERVLENSTLPAWMEKVPNDNGTPDDPDDDTEDLIKYVPSKADTAQGKYTFQGWFDQKQTDADYAETNGNKYEATTAITSDVTLYPQFKFEPFTYTVAFMSYDGKDQLSAGEFEFGQNIEAVTAVANIAAQGRPQDDTYSYSFIGWDQPVPTICEGRDMTFIAQYKPVYRYYDAKWFNSEADMEANTPNTPIYGDDGNVTGYVGLLTTTHHTYNSKLYSPAVTVTPPADNEDGTSNVFAGWYYKDADGNEVKYERGMLITGEMTFYAKYTATKKIFTVTTVVKGVETIYEVADGDKATIADPQSGYVDAAKHNEFKGWYTDVTCTDSNEFDVDNTVITENKTIYAKFVESEHDFTNKALKEAPTYYKEGKYDVWCSCNVAATTKTETIAMLTDTKKPTGTIYLGGGKWSSTDAEGAADIESQSGYEVWLYANAETDLIITTNDTGDVNDLYNPSGMGKGIKEIRAFAFPAETVLTADNYGAAQQLAITVFEADYEIVEGVKVYSEDLNNTANFAVKLGDMIVADLTEDGDVQYNDDDGTVKSKKLEDGESYIIYYYVIDKAGNMLNRKVRTEKFVYDTTAPDFEVIGNTNKDNIERGTPIYCTEATVTNIEVGATLTVNGEEIEEFTTTSAAGTGTYKITKADNYLITVTDKAGNSKSEKIKIADDHEYVEIKTEVTCTTDGIEKTECIVCGYVKTNKTVAHTGHVTSPTITPATCTENGFVVYTCENCDYTAKYEYELDMNGDIAVDDEGKPIPLYPAKGHAYDKDETGEIIYTVIDEPTCSKTGLAEAYCTECNEGRLTKKLATDPTAHTYTATVRKIPATCTEDGYTYRTCKYCGLSKQIETLYATDHNFVWTVETEATCGVNGTMILACTECDATEGEATAFDWVTEKDGDYTYVVVDGVIVEKTVTEGEGEDAKTVTYYQIYRLPKTNKHDWEMTRTEATEEAAGKTEYECKVCGEKKTVEIPKLVKYTVKFVNEDGTLIEEVKELVGNSVDFDGEDPKKANSADGKFKYTFAGWKAEGKTVVLPLEVTGDITLKASFTQSPIIYTHKFRVPNTWVSTAAADEETYTEFSVLMGTIGDVRVPATDPVFALADPEADKVDKKLYTYEFQGWKDVYGNKVTNFAIVGDATFYADFKRSPIGYEVIYYNGTSFVWSTSLNGGEAAEYLNYKYNEDGTLYLEKDEEGNEHPVIIYPTKDYDETNHYTFNKWYSDATLNIEYKGEGITAKTRLYAGFTATAHSYDKTKGVVTQVANCTLPELTTYTCECGHKITEQTADAKGHISNGGVKDDVTGITTYTCTVCGTTWTDDVATYTIKFVNENGLAVQTLSNIAHGNKIKFTADTPTKASDKANDYTFAGWIAADDTKYTTAEIEDIVITKDWIFKAYYTATPREYRVSYVDVDNRVLQTETGLHYGDPIPVFEGDTKTITKKYDPTYHYVFEKWSISTTETVAGDTVIAPVFTKVEHDYTETKEKKPTCEEAGGKVKVCTCGIEQAIGETIAPLGHTDVKADGTKVPHTIVPATIHADGSDTYVCTVCGKTITKTIAKLPSQKIVITVFDKDGKPAANGVATVTITNKANANEKYTTNTDGNGQAIFEVAAGQEWSVGITGKTLPDGGYGGTVGKDGSFTAGEESNSGSTSSKCSCSCHKNTFWGIIFRLFHKLLKLFTGQYRCCSDPDPRYFK